MIKSQNFFFLHLQPNFIFQHKLKQSQREKVRQFLQLTNVNEKTAVLCLAKHDWRLDIALDSFFTEPETYLRERLDRGKLEALYNSLRGLYC